MLLQNLDRHVAVGLDSGSGQLEAAAQALIVVQHAVVSQGKGEASCLPRKGMVVPGESGIPLSGHTGMPHDRAGVRGNQKLHPVGGAGPFVNVEPPLAVVGNSGGVGAPDLALQGQGGNQLRLLLCAEAVSTVHQSEQTAHYCSTSLSTGSFT